MEGFASPSPVNSGTLARSAGVSEAMIQATLNAPQDLPPDLALVRRFTEAVVRDAPDVGSLRRELAARISEAALVDLAFGIIVGQAFPILKRILGRERQLFGEDQPSPAAPGAPQAA